MGNQTGSSHGGFSSESDLLAHNPGTTPGTDSWHKNISFYKIFLCPREELCILDRNTAAGVIYSNYCINSGITYLADSSDNVTAAGLKASHIRRAGRTAFCWDNRLNPTLDGYAKYSAHAESKWHVQLAGFFNRLCSPYGRYYSTAFQAEYILYSAAGSSSITLACLKSSTRFPKLPIQETEHFRCVICHFEKSHALFCRIIISFPFVLLLYFNFYR